MSSSESEKAAFLRGFFFGLSLGDVFLGALGLGAAFFFGATDFASAK